MKTSQQVMGKNIGNPKAEVCELDRCHLFKFALNEELIIDIPQPLRAQSIFWDSRSLIRKY
jgi:hypothetical protein